LINQVKITSMKTHPLLMLLVLCLFYSENESFSQVPTSGLIAHYPFTGNANDASGNNRNGVISGGATLTTDRLGNANQAYAFNGSNGTIDVNNWNILTGNSPRTMMVWFKMTLPNTVNQWFLAWGSLVNSGSSVIGAYSSGLYYFGFMGYFNDLWVTNQFQFYDNQWHLMALTFDSSNLSLYLDGVLVNSKTTTLNTSSTKLTIGNRMGSEFFNGSLDEVRIYNRALTANEVQQAYIAEAPTTSTAEVVRLGADRFISTAGIENTFVGIRAGAFANTIGSTIMGRNSGLNTTGVYNSFYGLNAGRLNTTGYNNAFLGKGAGEFNTTGNENTYVGFDAGWQSKGSANVIVGRGAGGWATTGNNNVFVGWLAGIGQENSPNIGTHNTLVGSVAGAFNTSGNYNTFLGSSSGYRNTTGGNNSFLGHNSGYENTVGENNTFVGFYSGFKNMTGIQNTYMGTNAGQFNVQGNTNTFIGYEAGLKNTNSENVFIGRGAGAYTTTGTYNTYIGNFSGLGVESNPNVGSSNTFVGYKTGFKNTTGQNNVLIGWSSGHENTTGTDNTALGTQAGGLTTTGSYNTSFGKLAGYFNVTGSLNTYLGAGADGFGANKDNLSKSTAIGENAKVSISNAIVLGDTANVNLKVGIGTTRPAKRLEVRAVNPNESGIRTTNLTASSPTTTSNGKVLTVNATGDIVLAPDGGTGSNTHSDSSWVRSAANTNYIGGNVGIGVPIPTAKLDVNGPINIRGINGNRGELKFSSVNFLRGYKNFNGAFGFEAEVDSNVFYATAIGYRAFASASNVLVLGGMKENAVNVGIGNSAPTSRLEITSDKEGESGTKFTNLTNNWSPTVSTNKFLGVDELGNVKLYNLTSDNVLIKLKSVNDWSDNVFAKGSKLMSLPELESYIQENQHLPNIPSASEMVEKGLSVEQMISKLLKNQEQMMLHLIEMSKEIELLKKENLKRRR
jgi:trimeric autotransporter adhesin